MKIVRELIVLELFLNFKVANIIFAEIMSLKETSFFGNVPLVLISEVPSTYCCALNGI
jgi:hypothetical protein